MEWTLGVDTSSVELGLGLAADGAAAGALSRYRQNSHAEHITDAVKHLAGSMGIGAGDIARAGVAVGPGSFTGLRIGVAFVKGYLFGRPAKVLPVSSLLSIAASWHGPCRSLAVVLDARRGQVFWARFACDAPLPRRLTDDALSPVADAVSQLDADDVVVFDALGYARSTVPAALRCRTVFTVADAPLQRGLACARLAAAEPPDSPRWKTPVDLEPNYMRVSAPEERASAGN